MALAVQDVAGLAETAALAEPGDGPGAAFADVVPGTVVPVAAAQVAGGAPDRVVLAGEGLAAAGGVRG